MEAKQLLVTLNKQGINLYVEDGRLKSRAAAGAITPALAEKIKALKDSLILLLSNSKGAVQDFEIPEFDRRSPICLSHAQQRVWFIDLLEGQSPQYNIPTVLRLNGTLNITAVSNALDMILNRHEILRTRYIEVQGEGRQIIDEAISADFVVESAVGCNETQLHDKVAAEVSRAFNLRFNSMMRVLLLKVSDTEHILVFTLHHIAADGWSLGLIVKEFSELYSAACLKRTPSLTPLSLQYADFAMWQRKGNGKQRDDEQLQYWTEQLQELPELHSLPTDHPRPATQVFSGGLVHSHVDKATVSDLHQLAQRHNVTLFMLLQSAFAVVLSRYSGSSDIVMGTPTAGRHHKQLENMVGFFVNNLVLRHKIDPSLTFSNFLRRAADTIINGFANQDLPFDKIVEQLQPDRSMGHTPLFQIMFSLQNFTKVSLSLPGLTISAVDIGKVTAKFDLELSIVERVDGLSISWTYATSLFEQQTIKRLASTFSSFLTEITQSPAVPISSLSMIDSQERQTLLKWGLGPALTPAPAGCLAEYFHKIAMQHPNRVAAIEHGREISFQQLDYESRQIAQLLLRSGVQEGDFVGLSCTRSLDMLRGMLAILQVGAAYVPLDSSYPATRLAYMVEDANIKHLLIQASLFAAFPINGFETIILDDQSQWERLEPLKEPSWKAPSDVACVLYTSGTTGAPKGVLHRHQGIQRMLNAPDLAGLDLPPKLVHLASISFDAAHFEIWVTLLNAGCLVMYSEDYLDLDKFNALCLAHEVNMLFLTSSLFDQWCLHCDQLKNVKAVFTGGEAMTPASVARFYQALPESKLFNLYGPTESTTYVAAYEVPSTAAFLPTIPIGRVVAGTQLFVVDATHQLAPRGAIGELCIAGLGLAAGYLNKPDITKRCFVSLPHLCEGPVYFTGDQVRINSNNELEYYGRKDHQVKIRGFRIELTCIEAEILNYPKVNKAKVLAVGDKGQKTLVAFIETDQHCKEFSLVSLKQTLYGHLPAYMVPETFQLIDTFPLTANGKIDSEKLLAALRINEMEKFTPADNATEQAIHDLWCAVLGLERVDATRPFFAVGGNSINLIALKYQLSDSGYALSLKQLMENQTIRAQASLLIENEGSHDRQLECIVRLNEHLGDIPLFVIHPFGGGVEGYRELAIALEPYCPVFGVQAPFMYGAQCRHQSLNELAGYYTAAIRKFWSGRDVMLAGYSGGGQLAAIAAEQLNNVGINVTYVALFDTYFEDPDKQPNETSFERMCRFMYSKSLIDSVDEVPSMWKHLTYETLLTNFSEFVVEKTAGRIRFEDATLALDFSNDLLGSAMLPFLNPIPVRSCDYFLSTSNLHKEKNIGCWQKVFANEIRIVDVPYSHDIFMEPLSLQTMLPYLIEACQKNNKGE